MNGPSSDSIKKIISMGPHVRARNSHLLIRTAPERVRSPQVCHSSNRLSFLHHSAANDGTAFRLRFDFSFQFRTMENTSKTRDEGHW